MATKDHGNNVVDGMIVGYETSRGNFYGYKLLKEIYISEISEYRWIAQYGSARNGEDFKPSGDFDLNLLTDGEIRTDLPKEWTKGPEFKKGDILVGKGKSGKVVLFVYLSDEHVERLTPRDDFGTTGQFGYSTLSDYGRNFGPLTVHKTQGYIVGNGGKKFSDL